MATKNKPGQFDCYEAADPDEPMFVLLGRDESAPERVEEWALARTNRLFGQLASNDPPDREEKLRIIRKIAEALSCANAMRDWRRRPPEQGPLVPLCIDWTIPAPHLRDRETVDDLFRGRKTTPSGRFYSLPGGGDADCDYTTSPPSDRSDPEGGIPGRYP